MFGSETRAHQPYATLQTSSFAFIYLVCFYVGVSIDVILHVIRQIDRTKQTHENSPRSVDSVH